MEKNIGHVGKKNNSFYANVDQWGFQTDISRGYLMVDAGYFLDEVG